VIVIEVQQFNSAVEHVYAAGCHLFEPLLAKARQLSRMGGVRLSAPFSMNYPAGFGHLWLIVSDQHRYKNKIECGGNTSLGARAAGYLVSSESELDRGYDRMNGWKRMK
jgi:hypothetical protein